MILVVNTAFSELNHLAAGLADANLLSRYVRPYANLDRGWERTLGRLPRVGRVYARTIGRRQLPKPLNRDNVLEGGVLPDFLMAAHGRLSPRIAGYRRTQDFLKYARIDAVARLGAATLQNERVVVSSWGCAEPVFSLMKNRGGICVLNYPLAHHRFTRSYLLDEAARQPGFADTLNSHDWPAWYEARLEREIEMADQILVGSSFARESFISEGVPASKIVVVPYGVDTEIFQPGDRPDTEGKEFRLLFVGQIGQRKGISYLLETVRGLRTSETTLTMVGQIQGNAKPLESYSQFFRHIPHAPRSELREIFRRADVFVFPTLVEGMGLVVLEAMASGLPVITTRNGPGDIVRDGIDGFLVDPRDVDAMRKRIMWLQSDPKMRARMGASARRRAEQYTWSVYRSRTTGRLKEWLGTAEASV